MLRKLLLSLVLAVSAIPGIAALQASQNGNVVTLSEEVCSDPEVLILIPVEQQKDFFKADVLLQGTTYKPCWTLRGDNVLLVYPDGDQGLIPVSVFREAGV